MVQVDYSFYLNSYKGVKILEKDWNRLSQKSIQRLNSFTFGRIPDDWESSTWANQAKYAICEMSECIQVQEKSSGKTSENIDGYSVSYDTNNDLESKLYDIAYLYLGYTGLMSFGVDE